MPTIEKRVRQVIIDLDPKSGDVVGATKIIHQVLVEDGKDVGNLSEILHEDLAVADVPTIWGGTTDNNAAQLKTTADILAAEREATAVFALERQDAISALEAQRAAAQAEASAAHGKLENIGKLVLAIAKEMQA